MSKTEKQMNKVQLKAYKVFDNKNFGLVPGLNSSSQFSYYKSPDKTKQSSITHEENSKSQRDMNNGQNFNSRNNVDNSISQILNQPYYQSSSVERLRKPRVSDY